MIQGGDPLTKDAAKEHHWGTGGPGYQIKAEFNDRSHQRGVISMARSPTPIPPAASFSSATATPPFSTANTPRSAN
jgi:peptidyl-prolyl cis-trans isomerase B (cyclophilin B)